MTQQTGKFLSAGKMQNVLFSENLFYVTSKSFGTQNTKGFTKYFIRGKTAVNEAALPYNPENPCV